MLKSKTLHSKINVSDDDTASVWDFFKKLCNDGPRKTALCKLCSKIYNCNKIYNLKWHLHSKHSDVVEVPQIKTREARNEAKTRDFIWSYFTKTDAPGYANCNVCGKSCSYKTTIGNLRAHLQKRHSEVAPVIEEIIETKGMYLCMKYSVFNLL